MPHRRVPKPMENTSTRTPNDLATMKCPHSCTSTMMPRTIETETIITRKSDTFVSPLLEANSRAGSHPNSPRFQGLKPFFFGSLNVAAEAATHKDDPQRCPTKTTFKNDL